MVQSWLASHLFMRDLLPGLLERADLAMAACQRVIDASTLAPLTETAAAVRARLSYPDDVVVVALAGGTGSGKSSLFNALIGEEASAVGGMRPTTDRPLAGVPERHVEAMDGYLDRIGIARRITHTGDRLCFIDLPDTDSVETENRHRVDALLPVVDLVVWVVDPEKYRDARLHDDYLKVRSPYSGQFLFALNQIDRLSPEEQPLLIADFLSALADDGIDEPVAVAVAADPAAGPPIGLDSLRSAITDRLERGNAVYDKLLNDLESTAEALAHEVGGGLDFDRRARETVDEAAEQLMAGDETGAARSLVTLLDALASEAGGPIGVAIRSLATDVPGHIARIVSQVWPVERADRWWRFMRPGRGGDPVAEARSLVDEAVIRPARALLARRALAAASVAELSLEVSRIKARERR